MKMFDLNVPLEWLGLHSAFVLETSDDLPEYGADLLVYRHVKTDAKLAALVPKQPTQGMDKAFGIGFRTKPTSSNGSGTTPIKTSGNPPSCAPLWMGSSLKKKVSRGD